jgi:hypothetical protein
MRTVAEQVVRASRVAVAAAVLLVLAHAGPAGAASSSMAGWWTSAPVPVGPDAPPDGLVVQGGAEGSQPVAYAAVAFGLSPDERAVSLTLEVAEGSARTPNALLQVCRLTASFTPAHGGPMSEAPPFDCAAPAAGDPADDGSAYTFDLAEFAPGDLRVAVLPVGASDRVVLARPGLESLQTRWSSSSSPEGVEDATDSSWTGASEAASPSPGWAFDDSLDPPMPVVPAAPEAASTATSVAMPADEAGAVESSPVLAATQHAAGGSTSPVLGLVAGGLVLLTGASWLFAGRRRSEVVSTP